MTNSRLKRIALMILAAALLLAGCGAPAHRLPAKADMASPEYAFAPEAPAIDAEPVFYSKAIPVPKSAAAETPDEVRSVWISFLEYARILTGKTEAQFTAHVREMFDNIAGLGLNTVVVQARPYGDAIYDSAYFPWSFTVTGYEGRNPGFDPLAIMVKEARARNLRIEAWVNPYRIRPADRKDALSADNPAKRWLDLGDGAVIVYNGVTSYNPASAKAQDLIVAGIVELVKNYDIDAVHIDDYFYPTTDKAFDSESYARYTSAGGGLGLEDWRRHNVETLIKKIYAAVKKADRRVLFGISPQSSIDNNYNAQYLDIEKIAASSGYADYICPQIYFGFDNKAQPFAETLERWSKLVTAPGVKLYVGLAAYKSGAEDAWAGDLGRREWMTNTDLLKRMTQSARRYSNYGGIVLFRYDFMFEPPESQAAAVMAEIANLKGILK
jgi:uncharacterized lipoprotein YddW (UPF0748 family)